MQRALPDLQEASAQALLADDNPSVFMDGFYSPSSCIRGSTEQSLPWKSVREVIEMADNALKAKQRAADKLAQQVDALRQRKASDKLLKRAQRAEVDCGSLLDELQQLIQAKADVTQQRADLDRANALLVAERELLCQQLQVSPQNANLCQAVSRVLATARRAKTLDAHLRLLAKCQRELLLKLEAQKQAMARAELSAQQWQAEKQLYLQLLAEHGVKQPDLPEALRCAAAALSHPPGAAAVQQCAATAAAGEAAVAEPAAGLMSSSSLSSNSSALLTAQLMLMRTHSAAAATTGLSGGGELVDHLAGSPQALLTPCTPPMQDMAPLVQGNPSKDMLLRSHSLDSGLNSLTGLLDQLALGQLCGSDEGTDHMGDDGQESESWTMADAMSTDMEPWFVAAAAAMPGGSSSSGSCSSVQPAVAKEPQHLVSQQHLQPVVEACEES